MIGRILGTPANAAMVATSGTVATGTALETDMVKSAVPIVEMPLLFVTRHGDLFVLTLGNLFFSMVSIASIAGVVASIMKARRSKLKGST